MCRQPCMVFWAQSRQSTQTQPYMHTQIMRGLYNKACTQQHMCWQKLCVCVGCCVCVGMRPAACKFAAAAAARKRPKYQHKHALVKTTIPPTKYIQNTNAQPTTQSPTTLSSSSLVKPDEGLERRGRRNAFCSIATARATTRWGSEHAESCRVFLGGAACVKCVVGALAEQSSRGWQMTVANTRTD